MDWKTMVGEAHAPANQSLAFWFACVSTNAEATPRVAPVFIFILVAVGMKFGT
jgi:hypothetical protein